MLLAAVTSTLPLPQVAGGSVMLGPGVGQGVRLGPGVSLGPEVGQGVTLGPGMGQGLPVGPGVGQVNLKDLSQERMRHNMQESLCRTLRINKKGAGGVDPLNSTNNCSGAGGVVSAFPEHDTAALPPPPEDVVAPPDGDDMKASERLEKFINNMMKKVSARLRRIPIIDRTNYLCEMTSFYLNQLVYCVPSHQWRWLYSLENKDVRWPMLSESTGVVTKRFACQRQRHKQYYRI